MNRHVLPREAFRREKDGRRVTQQLLDRGFRERGVIPQLRHLFRVLQERESSVSDEVDGRFMSRDEKQEHHGEELVAAESVSLLFRPQERGRQIVPGLGSTALEEPLEIAPELPDRGQETPGRVQRIRRNDVARPGVELSPVFGGNPQNLRDDGHRERQREIGDEIHRAPAQSCVDQSVGELLGPRSHPLDEARGERLVHERTAAGCDPADPGRACFSRAPGTSGVPRVVAEVDAGVMAFARRFANRGSVSRERTSSYRRTRVAGVLSGRNVRNTGCSARSRASSGNGFALNSGLTMSIPAFARMAAEG